MVFHSDNEGTFPRKPSEGYTNFPCEKLDLQYGLLNPVKYFPHREGMCYSNDKQFILPHADKLKLSRVSQSVNSQLLVPQCTTSDKSAVIPL